MIILLFGVSNVGKSATGKLLAERLGYNFYDIDDEVRKHLGITLEKFVGAGSLYGRDRIRCTLINSLVSQGNDMVMAITPLSYIQDIQPLFSSKDITAIELLDSVGNIFDRLVFSDENDNIYKDDEYKDKYREHYYTEIESDLEWYGSVYSCIKNKFNMSGMTASGVADALVSEYHLGKGGA